MKYHTGELNNTAIQKECTVDIKDHFLNGSANVLKDKEYKTIRLSSRSKLFTSVCGNFDFQHSESKFLKNDDC